MRQDAESADGLSTIEGLLGPDARLEERVLSDRAVWRGAIFSAHLLEVAPPGGRRAAREIVRHHGGAGVCVVRDGRMCLVRQYRVALGRATLEIPAGKVDGQEDPAVCAARELREETGLVADNLEFLARSVGSPGFCDEATSIYIAHGLREGERHLDEGEFADVVWVPLDDVVDAVAAGLIQDSKTIVAALAAKTRNLG